MKCKILPFFFSLVVLFNACQTEEAKIKHFSFCRQLQKDSESYHCIPPLLVSQAVYYFANPNLSSTMRDYIISLADTRQQLAFCVLFNKSLSKQEIAIWKNNLHASYTLSSKSNSKVYRLNSLFFSKRSFCSEILMADLLDKQYPNAAAQSYEQPLPLSVSVYLQRKKGEQEKLLVKRTIVLKISHEPR